MKKTLISVAAASLMMGTVASADVDVDIGGQAVVYYQTWNKIGIDGDLFDQTISAANAGLQVNANADLGNGFGAGGQISALGTLGLEHNLVNNTMQTGDHSSADPLNSFAVSKIYATYKLGQTTIKAGRQELPKALSPFAFSEGWNVFKNTFEAALAINTDLPDTTIVAAYVSGGNSSLTPVTSGNSMSNFAAIAGGAYMLTAQNASLPMTTLTGSYYHVSSGSGTGDAGPSDTVGADMFWIDAKLAGKDMPLGLNVSGQYGNISPNDGALDDTTAMGLMVGGKISQFTASLAYTSVDDGAASIQNTTGVKTPLYTQMVLNQNYIKRDSDTIVARLGMGLGDAGALGLNYNMSDVGKNGHSAGVSDATYSELDLVYKTKIAGINMFAAYIYQTTDADIEEDNGSFVRVWGRYAF